MDTSLPLVLVPGLAGSPRIYAPLLPSLWAFGPVAVANHIRDASMGAIARRILAESPARFVLAGHSMGGYIAFEIMRQEPGRVAKLILINTQARPDSPEASARRSRHIGAAESGRLHAVLDELYPGFVHPSRADDHGLREIVHAMGDDVGGAAFARQQRAIIARADSRSTLATITCPTLVVSGDTDNTIPNSLSQEMADGIKGARLVIIPNCGHLPQIEQPDATAAALAGWLRN